MIRFDSKKATENNFAPIPAGNYECIIESGVCKKASTGTEYIDFKLKVRDDVEGQAHGGRILFGKVFYTEAAMGMFHGFLGSIGATEDMNFPNLEAVKNYAVGKAIGAKVKITKFEGEDRNEVGYMFTSKVGGGKIDDPLAMATGGVQSNDPFAAGGGPIEISDDDLPF